MCCLSLLMYERKVKCPPYFLCGACLPKVALDLCKADVSGIFRGFGNKEWLISCRSEK